MCPLFFAMKEYDGPHPGYPDIRVYMLARMGQIDIQTVAMHIQQTINSGTVYRLTGWPLVIVHDYNNMGLIKFPQDISCEEGCEVAMQAEPIN